MGAILNNTEIMTIARKSEIVIPAFNVCYLPVIKPLAQAVIDQDSFAFIETARLEWIKFESKGSSAVMEEFLKWNNPDHLRIHLDHIPVIDEDNKAVDYLSIIKEAIDIGYHSVMVDGSRLDLGKNIHATRQVVTLAHKAGVSCEAELGSVLGHESKKLPPYEELFQSGIGFTDIKEAEHFVRETKCDWLSVAIGSIHGAISGTLKNQKKVEARLDLDHLEKLAGATGIPLVLHGGSGIKQEYILSAIKKGISKVNIGTEIRQAYENTLKKSGSIVAAQNAVYQRASYLIHDYFGITGTKKYFQD